MLYKVTPMMVAAPQPERQKATAATSEPTSNGRSVRKKRKAAVYDAEGNEVLITMMCLKCKQMRPLTMFGLRKMADGAIRNQPWCRGCRSGASSKAKREKHVEQHEEAVTLAAPASPLNQPAAAEASPEVTKIDLGGAMLLLEGASSV